MSGPKTIESSMPRIYLTSYATERFVPVQCDLNMSAIRWGIPNILTYREGDLHGSDYYNQNRSILDEACGAGYWAWKPFFVLQALDHLAEGDILFYCDAGSMFVDSPAPLIRLCEGHPQGMIFFDAQPLTNRQFTKRDCFVRLACDEPAYWDASMVIATLFVLRKLPSTLGFMREWLQYCQDRAAITDDPNKSGLNDLPGFLQHRWDQSILSILCAKHKIETFRNPTLWGNFLKMPGFRVPGEPVVSPYHIPPPVQSYAPAPQANSPYGTLFEINRMPNFEGKRPFPVCPGNPGRSPFQRIISRLRRRK
jgi:hypothetical protein